MKPARILLAVILIVLTIASATMALATLLGYYTAFERFTATVSTGNPWNPVGYGAWRHGELSVWVYAPYLAAGDTTEVEVAVYGGLRIAIDEVNGSFGEKPVSHRGKGANWGPAFTRKGGSMAQDSLSFRVDVPPDARPGDVLELEMKVLHTLAVSEGGGFRDQPAKTSVTVPIRVYSANEAALWRWGNAGWALLMFGLPIGLRFCLKRAADELPDETIIISHSGAKALSALVFFALFAYGYLGYLVFALPLLRALSWPSGWSAYFLVGIWLVGSLGLVLLKRPEPPESDLPLLRDTNELDQHQGRRVVKLPPGVKAMDAPPIRTYELASLASTDLGEPPALSAVQAALSSQVDYIVSATGADCLELIAAMGRICYFRGPREGTALRQEFKGRLTLRVVYSAAVRPEQITLSSDSPQLVASCCLALCSLFGPLRIRIQGDFPWLDAGQSAVAAGSLPSLAASLLLQSCQEIATDK